jgi:hypothetical protein
MAFPPTNLSLSDVLESYTGITTGSINNLRGVTYYDSNGGSFNAPAIGVLFPLLQTFGGKFAHSTNGSVSDPPKKQARKAFTFGSIGVSIGPQSISYGIIGQTLKQLSFAVSLKADGQGSSFGEYTFGFSGSFVVDDTTTYNFPTITVDPVSSIQTFSVSGINKVTFILNGGAGDANASSVTTTGTWIYSITPTGLVFVSGP